MSAKNLQYYLEHTDEMPTDPKIIEQLANEHIQTSLESGSEALDVNKIVGKQEGVTPEVKPDVKPEDPKAEEKHEVKPEETPKEKADEKPEGILAKDGKNIIPYSQLESARQRAKTAEDLAKTQAEELVALRAAKETPKGGPDADLLTDEELLALEAESPTLAKVIRVQQTMLTQVRDKLQSVNQTQQDIVANEESTVRSEVQTAIDENPTLAGWQTAEDQTRWERAKEFDKVLRALPEYAEKSFEDRFKKVVELTQSALGEEPQGRIKEPAPSPEQVKAAAAAKLKAASKGKIPVSLSEIPGGAPPAVDERQKVEEMSATALGQQFLGMTKDQLDAYLATL